MPFASNTFFSCGAFIDLLHLPAQILILDFHCFFNFQAKKFGNFEAKIVPHNIFSISADTTNRGKNTHRELVFLCILLCTPSFAPTNSIILDATVAFFQQKKKQKKLLFAVLFLYLFDREMNANSLLASVFGPRKLFSRPAATHFCTQHKHTRHSF